MRKLAVIVLSLLMMCVGASPGWCGGQEQTQNIMREILAGVGEAGQKFEMIVPQTPLAYDVNLNWEVAIDKKGLAAEKEAAYLAIQPMDTSGKKFDLQTVSQKGVLTVPKGTRYKFIIYAGEYSGFFRTDGTNVRLKVSYPEAIIRYKPGDQAFQYDFSITGPQDVKDWKWHWSKNEQSTGANVSHCFPGAGVKAVSVETPGMDRKLSFEFEAAPLVTMNPQVLPLQGACSLTVQADVNSTVNYGQKANYNWDFGNGIKLEGSHAEYSYIKPGKYDVTLTTKVGEITNIKDWVVDVGPETITPNPVVTPLTGPVPLEVNGTVSPMVSGGPAQPEYRWEVGEQVFTGAGFKRTFTEPGEYQVTLKTIDKLHPQLKVPPETFVVKALPPVLEVKPEVSLTRGVTPLTVLLTPNLKVTGTPCDLKYRWNFGDGQVSEEERPTHTFTTAGNYLIQLLVFDQSHPGNLATASIPVAVTPPEMKATLTTGPVKGILPLQVNFSAQVGITGSPCEPIYEWNFGDGATSAEQNPVHTFTNSGVFKVTLTVKDRQNPANTVQASTQVETRLPKLRLTASVTPATGDAPFQVKCRAWGEREGSSNPQLNYEWNFGDGTTVSGSEVSHTFEKPGTYQVKISLMDEELNIRERKTIKVTVK